MCWLDKQTDALRIWLRGTPSPMLVSVAGGGILWANEAFERLLGYSLRELVGSDSRAGVSWEEITIGKEDLDSDRWLVDQMRKGARKEYTLTKKYLSKSGHAVEVVIYVQRYPHAGDIECLLVTVIPVEDSMTHTMRELRSVRDQVREALALLSQPPPKPLHEKYFDWVKANPVLGGATTVVLFSFFFGSRVIELFHEALVIFSGG